MRAIAIALAGLAACRPAASQTRESRATLTGAVLLGATPADEPQRGSVRLVVRGAAFIDDDCPDAAARQFVATYDGALAIEADGSFSAPIYARDPAVATPQGCPVHHADDIGIATITIEAWIPASMDACARICRDAECLASCDEHARWIGGHGVLDWQVLGDADSDALQEGSFGSCAGRSCSTRRSRRRRDRQISSSSPSRAGVTAMPCGASRRVHATTISSTSSSV